MVRQMMRPPGIWHPSSVVCSQVNFYPQHNVGQERNSHPCQYRKWSRWSGTAKSRTLVMKMAAQKPNVIVMCWGLAGAE